MSFALDLLLLASGWTHVILSPYTKVEESFNLHATHDVLMYGAFDSTTLYNYDHFTFPGAVPRTFIGSIALAWISWPVIRVAHSLGFELSKFDMQLTVRLVLATINAIGLCLLRRATARRFGRPTSFFFGLISAIQFHIPFWMGRTVPNMFALFPVNLALSYVIDRAPNTKRPSPSSVAKAVGILSFTAVVFRAEVAAFLGALSLYFLYSRYIGLKRIVKVGFVVSLLSIGFTTIVDSYFWDSNTWLWPEFSSIYFNVYEGQSANWGTSPWNFYFTTVLPSILTVSLPFAVVGALADARIRGLLVPCIAFLGVVSALEHKEWRFAIYVIPMFNIAAARGARWLVHLPKGSFIGRLVFLAVVSLLWLNVTLTSFPTRASMANYPGGVALTKLNERYANSAIPVHVHISNLAAQTGASLFLQEHAPPFLKKPSPIPFLSNIRPVSTSNTTFPRTSSKARNWTYSKTENLSLDTLTRPTSPYTHLIVEELPSSMKKSKAKARWEVVDSAEGFSGWGTQLNLLKVAAHAKRVNPDLLKVIKDVFMEVDKKEMLWILERRK